jgi:hypothetical protein
LRAAEIADSAEPRSCEPEYSTKVRTLPMGAP